MEEEKKTNEANEKMQSVNENSESLCEEKEAQNANGESPCEEKAAEDFEKQNETEKSEESELEKLKKENAELNNRLLRRAADFDNYRKRMLKEKQDTFDFANENLLRDLLDTLDNFDRTLVAAKDAQDAKSIADGVSMINASLVKLLEEKYNLLPFGKIGELFNPDEHEAIASEKGSVAEPVLKEVYLKGYKLKDRIIRHAKVMVTIPDDEAK